MVAALGAEIDLAETFVGAVGRFPDGFGEKLRIHEMGAGAGDEKAAVLHQLQAAQIDLPVALHRVLDGIAGFGEGGRVQNDHAVALPFGFQAGKQVEDIRAGEVHPVLQAVQAGVLLRHVDAGLGSVHAENLRCPGFSGVQCKGAGMGEAVQHPFPGADRMDGGPVVFLIQEKSGFLAVLHVNQILHAVFLDLYAGIEGL